MENLQVIDHKFQTNFVHYFRLDLEKYLEYVEEQTEDDFLNFFNLKKQFDGFLNSTNHTLIDTQSIIQFCTKENIDKLKISINELVTKFNVGISTEDIEIKDRVIFLSLKFKFYLDYFSKNYSNLFRYIDYQNYIRQGNSYVKFDEFES